MKIEKVILDKRCSEPIKFEEFKDIAQDGDEIQIGYMEREYEENYGHDGYYYCKILRMVEETEEEIEARIGKVLYNHILNSKSTMSRSNVGDFFFLRVYRNKTLESVRMLMLLSYDENSGDIKFQLDHKDSDNYLNTNVTKLHEHKWEIEVGVVKRQVIKKFGI